MLNDFKYIVIVNVCRSRDHHSRRSRSNSPKRKTFKDTMRDRMIQAEKDGKPAVDMDAIRKHSE